MDQIQHYIKKHGIDLCFDTDMSGHMSLMHYDRGENILASGDPMDYFYFIVEGKAKIFLRLENGKSLLLRFARPLSELGSAEIFRTPRVANSCVQSLYGTTVIRIPFTAIDQYAIHDVTFMQFIVKRLSHMLATASNAHSLNTSYPFKNRLASYLISITRTDLERIDEIHIEQFSDLATFLGTSYRHLSRVVTALEREGIIKKEKRKLIILDAKRLEELSGGFYE